MKLLTPQEIEVWYILPAIRKEFAKIMVQKGLNQKEAAKRLHLTEPAISQYLKDKRATEVQFNDKVRKEMVKSVDKILKSQEPHTVIVELQRMLYVMKHDMILCQMHKRMDSSIPSDCRECHKWW